MIDVDEGKVQTGKPYRVPASNSTFDHEANAWTATNLPRTIPDKREDVAYLEEWLTERLSNLASSHPTLRDPSKKFSSAAAEVSQQQLAVLNKGFFEVVRQVGINCADRAELMMRMWRASHELFENVIRDLTSTVIEMKSNAETWKEKHDQAHKDMDILIWKQSRDLETAEGKSKTHKSEDSAVYRDLQDELYQREKDMNMMESTLSDLSIWFPNFGQYGSSVLRKQLPATLDELEENDKELLPQDYFMRDMNRVKHVINTVSERRRSSMLMEAEDNEANSGDENKVKSESEPIKPAADESRVRSLVIDNQIQGMVLKESENKIQRMEDMEMIYKNRIEELVNENNHLHNRVSEGDKTTSLPTIPCFLKSQLTTSVACETADLYIGKRSEDSHLSFVPPKVVAVGDLQASLHKCCSDFLSNKITLNWHVHKGSSTERGLNIVSGSSYWRLMGTMEGANGPEMRVNSFESLLSFYLLHNTKNKLVSRECLRKSCWSVLLWKNKVGKLPEALPNEGKTIFNHLHHDTTSLPRQLREHEKPVILCISRLFGYFREEPDNSAIVHSLFFNLYMQAFSTLQRYIKTPETGSIMLSSSNLFIPAVASLIPVDKVGALVSRIFGPIKEVKLYKPVQQRRYSRAISLSITEKMSIFGGKKSKQRVKRAWWTCLPNSVLVKINEDLTLQSQKYSSSLVEVYDAIEVMWKHVYDYYKKVHEILENLYVFLEAITSGPLDPMFSTLLLAFLETKDTTLSVEHKMFSLEFISLSTQGLLTPTSFADTILEKPNVFLSGLHILFDENLRLRRELRREGLELLDEFKESYIKYTSDSDVSTVKLPEVEDEEFMARNVKRLTIIGRKSSQMTPATAVQSQASHLSAVVERSSLEEDSSQMSSILVEGTIDSLDSGRQFDVLLSYAMYCFDDDTLDVNDDGTLPHFLKCFDVYCAFVSMKCVSHFTEVTKSFCPLVDLDSLATSIRHRDLVLARTTFYGWYDYVEGKKQRAAEGLSDDSDDDMEEDEEEDTNTSPKAQSETFRRHGRVPQVFTATSLGMNPVAEEDHSESDDD